MSPPASPLQNAGHHLAAILNNARTAPAVLAAAGLVAQRLGLAVAAVHPRPDIDPDFVFSEEIMTEDRVARFEAEQTKIGAELYRIFAAWQPAANVVSHWFERRGTDQDVIAQAARDAGFLIMGASDPHQPRTKTALRTALLDIDCPVILLHQAVPSSVGARPAIGWDGSDAALEAAFSAMPLLTRADEVALLIGQNGETIAEPHAIIDALRQAGTQVTIDRFDDHEHHTGEALLARARAWQADLLIMGAYTHHWFVEALLGGATRTVTHDAAIPVLFRH